MNQIQFLAQENLVHLLGETTELVEDEDGQFSPSNYFYLCAVGASLEELNAGTKKSKEKRE
jgi:hypothetical protein